MSSIKIKANAKINIGLEVLYRRNDGFHEINTIFCKINLYDEIIITKNDICNNNFDNNIIVHCEPSLNISEKENIVFKAAHKFKSLYQINQGVEIFVKKIIPTGAGLAGGSSDAASTLLALSKLFNKESNNNELLPIAIELGADVPLFLKPGSAIGTNKGEHLEYFDYTIPYWILIVYPNINISTTWAYASLQRNSDIKPASNLKQLILGTKNDIKNFYYFKNDFEETVFHKYPEIKEIKSELISEKAIYSSLTGSGSAVYGFFTNEAQAINASKIFSNYKTFICKPI